MVPWFWGKPPRPSAPGRAPALRSRLPCSGRLPAPRSLGGEQAAKWAEKPRACWGVEQVHAARSRGGVPPSLQGRECRSVPRRCSPEQAGRSGRPPRPRSCGSEQPRARVEERIGLRTPEQRTGATPSARGGGPGAACRGGPLGSNPERARGADGPPHAAGLDRSNPERAGRSPPIPSRRKGRSEQCRARGEEFGTGCGAGIKGRATPPARGDPASGHPDERVRRSNPERAGRRYTDARAPTSWAEQPRAHVEKLTIPKPPSTRFGATPDVRGGDLAEERW
ncbi:hypothetical protein QBC98_003378 [Kitasatospora acidiphila]